MRKFVLSAVMGPAIAGILVVGVLAGVLKAGAAQAQFGLFLGNRGGVDLSDQDWSMFRNALVEAMRTAMQQGKPGSRAEWENPATKMHGDVVVERLFEKEGSPCGEVRARFIRNTEQPYRLTFCRDQKGQWAIAP